VPELSTLLVFSLAAIALIAIPGPNPIYITARSISEGRRSGLASALGVETGTLPHVAAAAAGLSALLPPRRPPSA
jgi:threonine/homoserine/homoserine lactone efflux protein